MKEPVNYPVYRKYKNGQSWFKVTGDASFEEIRKMGVRYLKSVHVVKILPERVMLHDLVFDFANLADEISDEEYILVEGLVEA